MSALEDFSRSAARAYLQSAVFVDDNIFDKKTGMPTIPVELPVGRKAVFKRENVSASMEATETANPPESVPEQVYHPKDLVSSFAREGITCALYEPPEGFSTDPGSEIFKLCERPDIIILDWDFSRDQGAKALDLIAALVRQSTQEFPHHTRLICVYTADLSLVAVANKIAERLGRDGLDATPDRAQCRLRSGATRLVVMGKPIGRFGEEETEFTVKELDLAERLINEFASMNVGILPSYALHGLAAIRRNSKRVLDRFHGDLDGPFVLHRALVAQSEEAFDQLPELLAEELRAVVEDQPLSRAQADEIAEAARLGGRISAEDNQLVEQFKGGMKVRTVAGRIKDRSNKGDHQRLAALFSCRTHYDGQSRVLTFGTVVRHRQNEGDAWNYALCLVPSCDSLRLKTSKVRFPFWALHEDLYSYNGTADRSGVILPSGDGSMISLAASASTAGEKLWTDTFEVHEASKTVVAHQKDSAFQFSGCAQSIFWVGQLKSLHAHRIVHDITQGLSRVGLTEAEWLRALCAGRG